jgi:hypothetical protein
MRLVQRSAGSVMWVSTSWILRRESISGMRVPFGLGFAANLTKLMTGFLLSWLDLSVCASMLTLRASPADPHPDVKLPARRFNSQIR